MRVETNSRKYSPSHVLIKRWVPEWEQDILWTHTARSRELAEVNERHQKQRAGVLECEYETKRLQWYFDKTTMMESRSWQVRLRDVIMTDGKRSMWIEEKDMVMVGLWVANRAALWIGAQDSRPLLRFMEELDTYLYVL